MVADFCPLFLDGRPPPRQRQLLVDLEDNAFYAVIGCLAMMLIPNLAACHCDNICERSALSWT